MTQLQQDAGAAFTRMILDRHSVRRYKKGAIIPEADLRQILEIAHFAPSAWNLQHWKLAVIQEQADKETLFPIANSQKQILDSAVTVAVLGDLQANLNAKTVYTQLAEAGGMSNELATRQIANINHVYDTRGEQFGRDHAMLNAGLISMQLMLAAKALGYDSVPMTGFDAAAFSHAFNIDARYVPAMLISIGIADEPPHQSPRLPLEKLIYPISTPLE